MSARIKYQPVLDLGEALNVANGNVVEEGDKLVVTGTVQTQYEKNQLWDKIKELGGPAPTDIMADIQVAQTEYFHKHTVVSGDTLGAISKTYYGESGKYMQIFNANTDQLSNPDLIDVGQVLIIPNP